MSEGAAAEATCPECGGRGWVVSADGGAGTAVPCDCRRTGLGGRLLDVAAIPPLYRGKRLSNFKTALDHGMEDQLLEARRASEHYVESFLGADGRTTNLGLIYVGPTGSGKTHLATAVLIELIDRYRVRGRFVECTSFLQELQSSFDPRSPASKHELLDPVVRAEVLVLDELGGQKPTAWVQDVLYHVINTRYIEQRPTLFTTNYALEPGSSREQSLDRGASPAGGLDSLAHRLSATLVSRLHEMAKPVLLDAVGDFRLGFKRAAER
jgi:DNA replication protein DnaC